MPLCIGNEIERRREERRERASILTLQGVKLDKNFGRKIPHRRGEETIAVDTSNINPHHHHKSTSTTRGEEEEKSFQLLLLLRYLVDFETFFFFLVLFFLLVCNNERVYFYDWSRRLVRVVSLLFLLLLLREVAIDSCDCVNAIAIAGRALAVKRRRWPGKFIFTAIPRWEGGERHIFMSNPSLPF